MKSNGWKFELRNPNMDDNYVGQKCVVNGEKAPWFGWSHDDDVGTLSATFTGHGNVTVDFGNCGDYGNVNLYLDSILIQTALVGVKSIKATFAFTPRSVLKLRDEDGNSFIMLNSVSINAGKLSKLLTTGVSNR